MTNLFAKYEADPKKETEGVEIDIDGAVFICRRAGGGNRRYRAAIGMGVAKSGMSERLNSADQDVALAAEDEVTIEAFADSVILGWRDVTDRDGNPWEYSRENFVTLMNSCPEVFLFLRSHARDIDNFRASKVKELGEKLGESSSGSDATAANPSDLKH